MGNWLKAHRPTPAMLVAVIALVIAATGVATALPGKNKVDSGDIANGQVKKNDLNRNVKTRWARINGESGDVIDQSGGISAERVVEGVYFVDFGRSVARHALIATNVDPGDGNDLTIVHVRRCGTGPGDLQFCSPASNNNPSIVHVETNDAATPQGLQDSNFVLTAIPR
jgi:hypothetical protein